MSERVELGKRRRGTNGTAMAVERERRDGSTIRRRPLQATESRSKIARRGRSRNALADATHDKAAHVGDRRGHCYTTSSRMPCRRRSDTKSLKAPSSAATKIVATFEATATDHQPRRGDRSVRFIFQSSDSPLFTDCSLCRRRRRRHRRHTARQTVVGRSVGWSSWCANRRRT